MRLASAIHRVLVVTAALCAATSGLSQSHHRDPELKVLNVKSIPSESALESTLKRIGYTYQRQVLHCGSAKLSWITIDVGSGGYLIHGYLFKEVHGAFERVRHVLPKWNRIDLSAHCKSNRVNIYERVGPHWRTSKLFTSFSISR